MKKSLHVGLLLFVVFVLAFSVTSCNLPFKIVSNVQATMPPPVSADTPDPSNASSEVPASSEDLTLADLVPVTGSILRWIDMSDFVYVPAAEFVMGQDENTPVDYMPAHTVKLSAFWIHQAEVTNQQYAACVSAGACTAPAQEEDTPYWYSRSDRANDPVVGITWLQASEYCEYIDSRLPTEAEWELAARGTQDTTYPWGEDKPACSLLNFDDCLDPSEPEEVRQYNNGASEFEAMDLAGNVFEWVNDWYAEDFYASSQVSNPVGPADGTQKVYRGGAYDSKKDEVSSFVRFADDPNSHAANLGFRCVLLGDYSAEGSTMQVPRSCSVLPIAQVQPEQGPTFTPIPCQKPDITGYCTIYSDGHPGTTVGLVQENCGQNLFKDLPSIGGSTMNCFDPYTNPVTGTTILQCSHPSLVQGATVDVDYCNYAGFPEFELTCPVGYKYMLGFCRPIGQWIGEPPCQVGFEEVNGMCFPNPQTWQGCPVGYYWNPTYDDEHYLHNTCIPLDMPCLDALNKMECEQPACPEGQTYDPENSCCSIPEKLKMVCPLGFTQFENSSNQISCGTGEISEAGCGTISVKVPYCPILTPTVTVTPPSPSFSCSDFIQSGPCKDHGCSWFPLGDNKGYCY